MKLFSLEGKVALVTGAGRGIGRGIAEGLARQGARTVCAARTRDQVEDAAAVIEERGGEALALELDVADSASVDRAVEAALDRFGQIDVLVNNAGINFREPLAEVTEEHFDQIVGVNLRGVYFLSQRVVRHMAPRKQGKIINIGSLTTGSALSQVSVYAATKGGIGSLTKAQALELAEHNIQVNALCPGFIVTPLTEKLWSNPTMRAWGEKRLASGKLGTPEDMVGTAVFLAAPASDYVTGQCIYVDGGYTLGEHWPLPQ